MLWVLLFVGIALAGLAVLALLVLRLWRSFGALLAEVDVAAGHVGEVADLLARIEVPGPGPGGEDAWPGTTRT